MTTKKLTIGFLAKAADVNIETIRYYQRISLIDEPQKPAQGYRTYSAATLTRIRFIKRAQELGFSLAEIAELLELGDGNCADVRNRAEQKRTQIDKQIKDLKNLRQTLNNLISTCQSSPESGENNSHCAIVETLTAD